MEQIVIVQRILPEGRAQVACQRKSACSGDCHTCHGCPHPEETVMVQADNTVGARKGDETLTERIQNDINAAIDKAVRDYGEFGDLEQ